MELSPEKRLARLVEMYGKTRMDLGEAQSQILALEERLAQSQAQLTQIRALMGKVAVYEGMSDTWPLVMMVSDLVKDHDALEGRIDAAVFECRGHMDDEFEDLATEVLQILSGRKSTPDTPEGLS